METAEHRAASGHGDRPRTEGGFGATPTCAAEALNALETVKVRLLARGDQRAAFPDIYAIITRRVAENVELGRAGIFLEPRWISRLAGRFCERYLTTLRWSLAGGAQDTGAWSVAYACCELGDMAPVQHVMLGLSAHINYDLALGIADNIREFQGESAPLRLARYKHDHDAVNRLLRDAVPEAFDHLVSDHRCAASRLVQRHAYATAEWLAMAVLTGWRERVWSDALDLLSAADPAARARVVRRLERRSHRYAKLLAIPGIIPLPTAPPGAAGWASRRAERLLQALS